MSAPKCSPPCCLRERRRFRHCSPFSPRGWQIMPESFWCSVALVTSLPRSLLHLLMGKWGWPGSGPSFPILVAGGALTVVQDSCDKDTAMGMHLGVFCRASPSPGQFMVTGRPQPPVGAALGSACSKTDLAELSRELEFPMLSAARALLGNPCWLTAQPGTVRTRSQSFALSDEKKKKSNQELIPCICICQTFTRWGL